MATTPIDTPSNLTDHLKSHLTANLTPALSHRAKPKAPIMPQFHPGQQVEIRPSHKPSRANYLWRKATILDRIPPATSHKRQYEIQFPDGTTATFPSTQIRTAPKSQSNGT